MVTRLIILEFTQNHSYANQYIDQLGILLFYPNVLKYSQ